MPGQRSSNRHDAPHWQKPDVGESYDTLPEEPGRDYQAVGEALRGQTALPSRCRSSSRAREGRLRASTIPKPATAHDPVPGEFQRLISLRLGHQSLGQEPRDNLLRVRPQHRRESDQS